MRSAFIRPSAAALACAALLLGSASCAAPAPLAAAPAHASAAPAAFPLPAAVPTAAELGLKFGTIANPLVKAGGTRTIRPAKVTVDASAGELLSRLVTVKGLPDATNKASVKVTAGTYTVTTTAKVRSRLDGKTYSYTSAQKLTVRPAVGVKAPTVSRRTVTPTVSAATGAKLTSKKITVTRNGKTIKRNVSSAKLPKGTYMVKTTAKYSFTSKSTSLAAAAGTAVTTDCVVTRLGTLRYGSIGSYVEGKYQDISWTCTGGFDGKLAGNGYYFPDTSGASGSSEGREFVFYLAGGPASFSLSRATVGTAFKHTMTAPEDLYLTTATKVSGTTSKTHTVKVG
ncbi:hypothetical protein GCM10023081_15850 [Arthrobacter ginkgonis]|uniref:Uncharacterized protein n=1 Tax=Arthrobacter ginkgonis TaxID=1630594 RepID=A0ABP7C5Y2_9MICC